VKKIEGEQGYGRIFFLEKQKKKSNPGKKYHKYLVKNQKIGESLRISIWVLIET